MKPQPGMHFAEAGVASGLRGWAGLFWRHPSPRIIATVLVVSLAARLIAGGWRGADAVVVAGFVAAQPFTEWILHVAVLHFRPRHLGGRRLDLYIARKHRAHHLDPEHVGLVFVQQPALLGLIAVVALALGAGFRDPRLGLSGMSVAMLLLLAYEWTHYLIHTPYPPRSRLYRHVWRAHRLHHFKNERYWFGITSHIADHVLRTFPARSAVETSATCRNLHGESALAG